MVVTIGDASAGETGLKRARARELLWSSLPLFTADAYIQHDAVDDYGRDGIPGLVAYTGEVTCHSRDVCCVGGPSIDLVRDVSKTHLRRIGDASDPKRIGSLHVEILR